MSKNECTVYIVVTWDDCRIGTPTFEAELSSAIHAVRSAIPGCASKGQIKEGLSKHGRFIASKDRQRVEVYRVNTPPASVLSAAVARMQRVRIASEAMRQQHIEDSKRED